MAGLYSSMEMLFQNGKLMAHPNMCKEWLSEFIADKTILKHSGPIFKTFSVFVFIELI